jgi:hypothetical protein
MICATVAANPAVVMVRTGDGTADESKRVPFIAFGIIFLMLNGVHPIRYCNVTTNTMSPLIPATLGENQLI